MAGIRTSKHIVSIDEDPDARILKTADLAIQGDLFSIVPALIKKLNGEAFVGKNVGKKGERGTAAKQTIEDAS